MKKREVPVNREYIIKPFMIDNNLNKKKKQPKFVAEGKYKLDEVNWREELTADWMFMETCRHSVCIRTVSCLLSKTTEGTSFFNQNHS